MDYIEINGVKINIKHYGFSESDLLDGRLRNLLNEVIEKTKQMYERNVQNKYRRQNQNKKAMAR